MWSHVCCGDHIQEIGVRELKASLSAVLRRVSGGEQVRVMIRSRPVADIVPAGASPADDALRSLIAERRVVPPARSRPPRPPAEGLPPASECIDRRHERILRLRQRKRRRIKYLMS
jgi:prevent-host-death family protein